MANLGFIEVRGKDKSLLQGELVTLEQFLLIELIAVERIAEKSPTHEIWAKGRHGHRVNVGVAWEHGITRGPSAGGVLYALRFDGPGIPEMWLSAFPAEKADRWILQSDRQRNASVAVFDGAPADAENGVA